MGAGGGLGEGHRQGDAEEHGQFEQIFRRLHSEGAESGEEGAGDGEDLPVDAVEQTSGEDRFSANAERGAPLHWRLGSQRRRADYLRGDEPGIVRGETRSARGRVHHKLPRGDLLRGCVLSRRREGDRERSGPRASGTTDERDVHARRRAALYGGRPGKRVRLPTAGGGIRRYVAMGVPARLRARAHGASAAEREREPHRAPAAYTVGRGRSAGRGRRAS
eukprot:9492471-Pyramimonas_sp.AAC.2